MPHTDTPRRPPLLWVPDARGRSVSEVLDLPTEEARHVAALRLESGSSIRLTDGAGGLWAGRLRSVGTGRSVCVLEACTEAPARLPVALAFAVANKTHTLWLVEKATELGVARLIPIECDRSRSVADAARSPSFWRKAHRRAVSAMKQSGGAWLPDMEPPKPLADFLDSLPAARPSGDMRVLLDGSGEPLARALKGWDGAEPLTLLVGPEGGLTDAEIEAAGRCGFRLAGLGPLVLRFETAAIAAVAVALQHVETSHAEAPAANHAPRGAGDCE